MQEDNQSETPENQAKNKGVTAIKNKASVPRSHTPTITSRSSKLTTYTPPLTKTQRFEKTKTPNLRSNTSSTNKRETIPSVSPSLLDSDLSLEIPRPIAKKQFVTTTSSIPPQPKGPKVKTREEKNCNKTTVNFFANPIKNFAQTNKNFSYTDLKETDGIVFCSIEGNDYCSGEWLEATATGALKEFKTTIFLIIDEPYWLNVFPQTNDEAESRKQALEKTITWWNKNEKTFINLLEPDIRNTIDMTEFSKKEIKDKITIINNLAKQQKKPFEICTWEMWEKKNLYSKTSFEDFQKNSKIHGSVERDAKKFVIRNYGFKGPQGKEPDWKNEKWSKALTYSKKYLVTEAYGINTRVNPNNKTVLVYPGEELETFREGRIALNMQKFHWLALGYKIPVKRPITPHTKSPLLFLQDKTSLSHKIFAETILETEGTSIEQKKSQFKIYIEKYISNLNKIENKDVLTLCESLTLALFTHKSLEKENLDFKKNLLNEMIIIPIITSLNKKENPRQTQQLSRASPAFFKTSKSPIPTPNPLPSHIVSALNGINKAIFLLPSDTPTKKIIAENIIKFFHDQSQLNKITVEKELENYINDRNKLPEFEPKERRLIIRDLKNPPSEKTEIIEKTRPSPSPLSTEEN